jgi:hypothetical protein
VFNWPVPNQRRAGQVFIGFHLDTDLIAAMEAARGCQTRSQFIRETIAGKLREMGVALREDIEMPPDRVRKAINVRAAGHVAVHAGTGVQHNTFTSAQGGRGAHARYKASKKKKKG